MAGRGEVELRVAENGFGGNEEFKLSGERLRTIFGGWVRDDVVKLSAGSIYRSPGRWRLI
jgi:hypothetical protein